MSLNYESVPNIQATDLEQAWLNFEPDVPLPPQPDGKPHPFYVLRPEDPIGSLRRRLLRPTRDPKLFFSGHRGCGKSTELLRLRVNPKIQKKFFPIFFSIRNHADIFDIDYRDILLIIGSQMFLQLQESGESIPNELLTELDSWRGRVETHVTTLKQGRYSGNVDGAVGTPTVAPFFARISGSLKIEPQLRREIRQHFGRNITELLDILNLIGTYIYARTKRKPLVLIDDLDKLDLEFAKTIFHDRQQIMRQPAFPIIYTVSSSLFYTPECSGLRTEAYFVPNVRIHAQGDAEQADTAGMRVMNRVLNQRLASTLIAPEARGELLKMCGGVFRELAHLVQIAADHAIGREATQIALADVERATAELRKPYFRILTAEQRSLLQAVRDTHQMVHPDKLAVLFQILAVLEYHNGDIWCDVHPALEYLLDRLPVAE
ncbi:MAG: hypothetical protein ACPG8W_21325 [Candidatus Promineifilaceae bacterium]